MKAKITKAHLGSKSMHPAKKRVKVIGNAGRATAAKLKRGGNTVDRLMVSSSINVTRHQVALEVTRLVVVVSLIAIVSPQGLELLKTLLPMYTFVLGFLFPARFGS